MENAPEDNLCSMILYHIAVITIFFKIFYFAVTSKNEVIIF